MKRTITVAFALLFAIGASAAEVTGVWTASVDEKKPGRVYLSIARDRGFDMGMSREISRLPGLGGAQLDSQVQVPVSFELRSEAGTAHFGGTFRNGHGAGHFVFNSDRTYIDKLRALGVEFDLYPKRYADEDSALLTLATHDVSTAYIKSMREAGYDESLKTYLSMRIHDVTAQFVRELRDLGFRDVPSRELTSLRIHNVTPEYIRSMRANGDDPTLRELVSTRIHGATPEFAAEMKRLGYDISQKELVAFRIHDVTEEFIKELRSLGYDKVAARDLTQMRIHGVTPDYIRELNAAGYKNVPVRKLISMRIHGLDVRTIEKLNAMQ